MFVPGFAWRDLRGSGHSLWLFCTCLALGVTLVAATGGLYQQVSHALLSDTETSTRSYLRTCTEDPRCTLTTLRTHHIALSEHHTTYYSLPCACNMTANVSTTTSFHATHCTPTLSHT